MKKGIAMKKMNNLNKQSLKGFLFSAILTATLAVGTGVAHADLTISYTNGLTNDQNIGLNLTAPVDSISLQQFNSSLGTLNSVTVNLSSDFNYYTTLTNSGSSTPITGTFTVYQQFQIVGPGQTLPMLNAGSADNYTYKTTLSNIANGATATNTANNTNLTSNNVTISGAALANYIGTGNQSFDVYNTQTTYEGISGGNYSTNGVDKSFDTTVQVTYDYTPTPIPAAAYLFGSGLLGLVGIRKKMQK